MSCSCICRVGANPNLASAVCSRCRAWCTAGPSRHVNAATLALRRAFCRRRTPGQAVIGTAFGGIAWMWEDEYQQTGFEADTLLGLLGFFASAGTEVDRRHA